MYSLESHRRSDSYEYPQHMDRVKLIWYLSPMRAAKVQASLHIRAVSPEPLLLAHTSSESRRTFRQNARSLAPLNGWACTVKICHDGMLEDTNSLEAAHMFLWRTGEIINKAIRKMSTCAPSTLKFHTFCGLHETKRCWKFELDILKVLELKPLKNI